MITAAHREFITFTNAQWLDQWTQGHLTQSSLSRHKRKIVIISFSSAWRANKLNENVSVGTTFALAALHLTSANYQTTLMRLLSENKNKTVRHVKSYQTLPLFPAYSLALFLQHPVFAKHKRCYHPKLYMQNNR